jgi:type II secretory pathway component PulF
MPNYSYTAKSLIGKNVTGVANAKNTQELAQNLKNEGLGISREGVRQKKDRALWNLKRLIKNKKIDIKDIFKIG